MVRVVQCLVVALSLSVAVFLSLAAVALAQDAAPVVAEPGALQSLIDLIKGTQDSYNSIGVIGAMGAAVYGFIKLYRMNAVQALVVKVWPKLAWDKWPRRVKVIVIFGAAAIASSCAALATGTKWPKAAVDAILAGVAAIGADQVVTGMKPSEQKK